MADFYTYRNEFSRRRRKRRVVLVLLVILALICAAVGWYWQQKDAEPQPAPQVEATPTAATATPEVAVTPEPTPATGKAPERIVQAVDTAVWDTSTPVAQTIDTEYLNTDHRMIGVPMLGTVTNDYFNTVTFVGDSIASGLGIYQTGLPNAKYATYTSAGVNSFVNNVTMKNAVTGVQETPMEAIVATQPDYVYILVGTNNLVTQGGEESFLAYYERLIDMLREQLNPGVIFYIQAIPGVQETVVQSKPGLDNARIATVNDLLANLALRKGCYFVNIREVLTDPADGSQIDDYQVTDGVHFNAAGYRVWAEYLATHTVWNRRSQYSGQNPYYIYGA
ncbi:MAG: SGNH/GDSL hydrolase family protein [Gemmiger sp.]|uniref:SGNH/GDSL hydrolase family protein n=1 Tax=Gemmiger sp. TaxID=2049027 RepID=UPI002E75D75A|nr:SGNH/GDSL hydrolase family protein [Gemmiger sp.]MEE0708756.1 SGNH/GDSL hydrolase family protein [Gemmiger sp.]